MLIKSLLQIGKVLHICKLHGLVNLDPIIFILGLDGSESVKDEASAKIKINYRIVQ